MDEETSIRVKKVMQTNSISNFNLLSVTDQNIFFDSLAMDLKKFVNQMSNDETSTTKKACYIFYATSKKLQRNRLFKQ